MHERTDHAEPHLIEEEGSSISIAHLVHTIQRYRNVIKFSLLAVALLYAIAALVLYLLAPAQRITSQQFRLDFEGAATGHYPNGVKFTSAEILTPPVLSKVFNDNELARFTTFGAFSKSLFILEANATYDQLATEYQARIADSRLTAIDRDRILKEWQSKAANISKNDFSINYLRTNPVSAIPETVVRKVLIDILSTWAGYAAAEEHVLEYRLDVLSPQIIARDGAPSDDSVAAIHILRLRISRVLANIDQLREIPGISLVRTSRERMSLEEVRLRLEELLRFRVEPLAANVRTAGTNVPSTVSFVETQLAYDQRQLKSLQDGAASIRDALSVYSGARAGASPEMAGARSDTTTDRKAPQGETVVISDTFLDRIVSMTGKAADVEYRQKLVDDFRAASARLIPLQQAVTYDEELLSVVRNSRPATNPSSSDLKAQIASAEQDFGQLIGKMNEIYKIASRNLYAPTQLYTPLAPPTMRTERTRGLPSLMLYGLLLMLIALPVIIFACLLHARVREEEATESHEHPPTHEVAAAD